MENTSPLTGTCGTISWQLPEIKTRLIIMWSVPFNFNLRDSYFAIGLTHNKVKAPSWAVTEEWYLCQGKFENSDYWFNQMYYGSYKGTAFTRSRAGRPSIFSSSFLKVRGFMEANTYHSVLNISVFPRR